MSCKRELLVIILVLFSTFSFAQKYGSISGKVIDLENGELITGANIILENTKLGASSDVEGKYSIKKIPDGTYTITASFVSYSTKKSEPIVVKAGEDLHIDITLSKKTITTDDVLITAQRNNQFETAILNQQKKSIQISDGISLEQIKKSTDVTTADALKRISGVTLFDNKFVYIRGTSERYSNAMLNNSSLASTEPDKKSFAFDLIPSGLIENTIIYKSYSPDNPGDFAGGLIKVNTVDFPEKSSLSFAYSAGYLSETTTKTFKTYSGGKYDMWGIDDGTRSLPDKFPVDLSLLDLRKDSLYASAKMLNNSWSTKDKKAPFNQSFGLSYGDFYDVMEQQFGIVASLTYRINHSASNIIRKEFYADETEKFNYSGQTSQRNILWGGILNLSTKIADFHKVSLKNQYTLNSDDEVTSLRGFQYDKSAEQITTALRFVSRSLFSSQLNGESAFPEIYGTKLFWRLAYSESKRDEPDYRRYTYTRTLGTEDPFYISLGPQTTLALGGRYFSVLKEYARTSAFDIQIPISDSKIKFGGLYENKARGFNSRLIGMTTQNFTDFKLYYYGIDSVFDDKNFKSKGFSIGEYVNGTNNYTVDQEVAAGYLMAEVPFEVFGSELKVIGGFRFENYVQRLNTMDYSNLYPLIVNQNYHNLLPSVNFIYKLNDKANLRLSYSKTVNRPEFREIAPFTYYDFQTQTSVSGNDSLKSADIQNFDFRVEIFPEIRELFSFSIFYKSLHNAIEKVVTSGGQEDSRTFANSDKAINYGFELELRASMRYISEMLSNFYVSGNYTYVKSEIDEVSSGSGKSKRPLQGQSPYVINLGLNYDNPEWGTNIALQYNKFGKRIIEVANFYKDDIMEEGRDVVDIVITQAISSLIELKFSAKDILGQDQEYTLGKNLLRANTKDPSITMGFTLKL